MRQNYINLRNNNISKEPTQENHVVAEHVIKSRPQKRNRRKSWLLVFIVFVILFFIFITYYKLNKKQTESIRSKEIKTLVSEVSQIYLFPNDEIPTVATVSNPETLKDQSFFKNPVKGDKVLIFLKAGRAVLYRPSIEKIIEIVAVKKE